MINLATHSLDMRENISAEEDSRNKLVEGMITELAVALFIYPFTFVFCLIRLLQRVFPILMADREQGDGKSRLLIIRKFSVYRSVCRCQPNADGAGTGGWILGW